MMSLTKISVNEKHILLSTFWGGLDILWPVSVDWEPQTKTTLVYGVSILE